MSSTTEQTTAEIAETAALSTTAATPVTPAATVTPVTDGQYGILLVIVLFIFIIVAIYCLIKSLMCFGKSGSTAEKIFGVIIAFFTGPFYLLYLNFNEGYCNDEAPAPSPPQMIGGRRRK